jgi:gliding motility-associated-like protein
VINDNLTEVTWEPDTVAFSYVLERYSSDMNPEEFLLNKNYTVFFDSGIKANINQYTYLIIGIDSCGRSTDQSRVLKNILLQGHSEGNDIAIIKWDPFEQWQFGVREYLIEVSDNEKGLFKNFQNTTNTDFTDLSFSDSNSTAIEKCYRIRAIENSGNLMESVSNIICLPYHPMIWIPNSFTPNGDQINDLFRPVCMGLMDFEMIIYNRWGKEIFRTIKQEIGWGGKVNNRITDPGMYYYTIRVKGKESDYKQFTGYLYLIR